MNLNENVSPYVLKIEYMTPSSPLISAFCETGQICASAFNVKILPLMLKSTGFNAAALVKSHLYQ